MDPPAAVPKATITPLTAPIVEPSPPARPLPEADSSGLFSVDYKGGQLSVVAQKAELGKILQLLGSKTGASVEVAPEISAEPVVAHLGPGTPTQIIGELLDSPHLEYIVMGSDESGGFKRIVVRRRASFARQPLAAMQPPQPAPAIAARPAEDQEAASNGAAAQPPQAQAPSQPQDDPPQL